MMLPSARGGPNPVDHVVGCDEESQAGYTCRQMLTKRSANCNPSVSTIGLQVQPSSAQIFVDGEFVGTVDDHASGLVVAPGVHRVEFRAPGFDPVVVDVRVAPGGRITYRASLKPSA